MPDGCEPHGVLPGTVRAWWASAKARNRRRKAADQPKVLVALCECCGSPAMYVAVRLADGQEIGGNSLCQACGGPAPVRIEHEAVERQEVML